mmetsp:Transcript_2528/g.5535  ORF Transcript_2528/g.5535 Transcript_2528/m.5535 type:complete len:282 (+) Transcript_2528:107-952(+)
MGGAGEPVWLYMYDLTKGAARSIPPWMLGFQLDAIWHTGIVAFGYEYYFARDAVRVPSGSTVFGAPERRIPIGTTAKSELELRRYICSKLKPMFHSGTYCVVTNNCNHFSDEICMYLVGQHLPEEVLRQPELLMQVQTVRLMRPLLNLVLGHYVTEPPERSEAAEEEATARAIQALQQGKVIDCDTAGVSEPKIQQILSGEEVPHREAGLVKPANRDDIAYDELTPSDVGELEDLLLWLDQRSEVPEDEPPQIPEVTPGSPVRLGLTEKPAGDRRTLVERL